MTRASESRYCPSVESQSIDLSLKTQRLRKSAMGLENSEGHLPSSAGGDPAPSIGEVEFVAQDLVAMGCANGVLIEPALAAHFARRSLEMCRHGAGDLIAQIEIAADALVV